MSVGECGVSRGGLLRIFWLEVQTSPQGAAPFNPETKDRDVAISTKDLYDDLFGLHFVHIYR